MITLIAGVYIYMKMGKTKKLLLQEQMARLEAKKNLRADEGLAQQENFWQGDEVGRGMESGYVRPPSQARVNQVGRLQEYELEENRREYAKPAEFI